MTTTSLIQAQAQAAALHFQSSDPLLAKIVQEVGPYTLEPNPDTFLMLVRAIVSQQISVQAAASILGRLQQAVGGDLTPETLAPLTSEQLRTLGLSRPKIRYLGSLLEHIQSHQLDLPNMYLHSDELIIQQLTAVTGIGVWSAEIFLIFSLGRPDVLPAEDLGLRDIAEKVYALPTRPTARALRQLGEIWRPYRTFASWYLWQWRRHLMQVTKAPAKTIW